jgi:hypothetical protein
VTVLDELAESVGILVSASRSETLVGHVEEGKVTSILDNLGELIPLSLARVDSSRVVSASVQQDDRTLGGGLLGCMNKYKNGSECVSFTSRCRHCLLISRFGNMSGVFENVNSNNEQTD